MSWVRELKDKTVTIVKTMLGGSIRVTDEYRTNTQASFPTVYLEFLESPETAMDLENDEVNAINFTVQVNVYTTDRTECKAITDDVLEIVKRNLRMTIAMLPIFYEDGSVTNGVFRARRIMGQGDTFLT